MWSEDDILLVAVARLNEAVLDRVADCLESTVNSKLTENVSDLVADGAGADKEAIGDGLRRQSVREATQDSRSRGVSSPRRSEASGGRETC